MYGHDRKCADAGVLCMYAQKCLNFTTWPMYRQGLCWRRRALHVCLQQYLAFPRCSHLLSWVYYHSLAGESRCSVSSSFSCSHTWLYKSGESWLKNSWGMNVLLFSGQSAIFSPVSLLLFTGEWMVRKLACTRLEAHRRSHHPVHWLRRCHLRELRRWWWRRSDWVRHARSDGVRAGQHPAALTWHSCLGNTWW